MRHKFHSRTPRPQFNKDPQIIEVTTNKKVVRVLQDWKTVGSASAVQVMDDPDIPENPGESEHCFFFIDGGLRTWVVSASCHANCEWSACERFATP